MKGKFEINNQFPSIVHPKPSFLYNDPLSFESKKKPTTKERERGGGVRIPECGREKIVNFLSNPIRIYIISILNPSSLHPSVIDFLTPHLRLATYPTAPFHQTTNPLQPISNFL